MKIDGGASTYTVANLATKGSKLRYFMVNDSYLFKGIIEFAKSHPLSYSNSISSYSAFLQSISQIRRDSFSDC